MNKELRKKKSSGVDLKPIFIWVSIILSPLIIYISYRIFTSDNRLIPISVIALISGVIIENKQLTQKWSAVFNVTLFAFVLSFYCFLPDRHESNYIFDNHIQTWPYTFLFLFIIFTIVFNKDKLIPDISEGITLLMSVAIIYWIIDHGFFDNSSNLLKIILITGFLFAGFSIINAFIDIPLTKGLRLFLSLWSSIIMALLAIDNIYSIYSQGQIEDSPLLMDKLVIGLQYFLLGISSIFIAQNIIMIIGFLPSRGRFFNDEYFKDLKTLTNDHINRYSDKQSNFFLSLFSIIITGTFFALNYHFNFLPGNTAIWIVFFLLNKLVYIYNTKEKVLS